MLSEGAGPTHEILRRTLTSYAVWCLPQGLARPDQATNPQSGKVTRELRSRLQTIQRKPSVVFSFMGRGKHQGFCYLFRP